MAIQNRKDFKHIRVAEAVYRDTKLKASDKAVYTVLSLYADRNTSECYPSRKTLMAMAGVSSNTLAKSINNLRSLGYVEVEARFVEGARVSNLYRLMDETNLES